MARFEGVGVGGGASGITNVGGIYYDAQFNTEDFRTSGQEIENIAKRTDENVSNSLNGSSKSVDALGASLSSIISPVTVATAAITAGFGAAAKASFDQVRAVENASFALRAFEPNAQAVNTVLGQLVEYARSDMGVLFQREELFQAAANLKGFGEATGMLTQRVQTLSKGVALGYTSFDELSQIVGRATQQGNLSAIAFDQLASRGIILDSSLRGAAVGADELYEALDAALPDEILEGRMNTIDGLIVRLQSSFRDLGATILGVDRNTSQFIQGGLGQAITDGIVSITEFIKNNQNLIIIVGTTVAAFGTLITSAYAVVKAVTAMRIAFGAASGPIGWVVTGISALLGIGAGIMANRWVDNLDKASDHSQDIADTTLDTKTNFGGAVKEADKLGKQLRDIDKQMQKVRDDFRESLAELVQSKNEQIRTLREQLDQERVEYEKSYSDRLYDFEQTEQKEAEAHEKKTALLTKQIDFLRRYNTTANQRRLVELQFALNRENAEYTKRLQERQTKYDQDADYERKSYEKRQAELQKRLDNETALLEKHRQDVEAIRNVILLDEIEKLKRSRDEQLQSLKDQREETIKSANTSIGAANAIADAFKGPTDQVKELLKVVSATTESLEIMAGTLQGTVVKGLQSTSDAINLLQGQTKDLGKSLQGGSINIQGGTITLQGKADGGPVNMGNPYIVGERGPELFVPNKSGTIVPNHNLNTGSVDSGQVFNITVNASADMIRTANDRREFANEIFEAFNQGRRAKGLPNIGVA